MVGASWAVTLSEPRQHTRGFKTAYAGFQNSISERQAIARAMRFCLEAVGDAQARQAALRVDSIRIGENVLGDGDGRQQGAQCRVRLQQRLVVEHAWSWWWGVGQVNGKWRPKRVARGCDQKAEGMA